MWHPRWEKNIKSSTTIPTTQANSKTSCWSTRTRNILDQHKEQVRKWGQDNNYAQTLTTMCWGWLPWEPAGIKGCRKDWKNKGWKRSRMNGWGPWRARSASWMSASIAGNPSDDRSQRLWTVLQKNLVSKVRLLWMLWMGSTRSSLQIRLRLWCLLGCYIQVSLLRSRPRLQHHK